MKTKLHPKYQNTLQGEEAEAILRACVHCGFCTATCPTYQELGDERDGPRGRIYLIKQLLETDEATANTQRHLDRCLTCLSCETTCPSGVQYGHLVDIGREIIEEKVPRPWLEKSLRWGLRKVLPNRRLFGWLLKAGQFFRPVLPTGLQQKIPPPVIRTTWPVPKHKRQMVLMQGCVQSVASPNTNAAAARVFDRLGITLKEVAKSGCCGAVNYHLADPEAGRNYMRRNIEAWWPEVEAGAEAILMTASGCGQMVKGYGHALKDDPQYCDKARRITEMTYDISEILLQEDLSRLPVQSEGKVAVHCPCTLQHGQNLPDTVDQLLSRLGVPLTQTHDKHLCCGSAGTYSVLQPKMSLQLRDNKLKALSKGQPDQIVTSNIGCQLHLNAVSERPVEHWIELLDRWQA